MICDFFSAFSKIIFNFEDILKTGDPYTSCIFELTDSEKRC